MPCRLHVAWCMTVDGALIPSGEVGSRLGPQALAHLQAFRSQHPPLAVDDPSRLREALDRCRELGLPSVRIEGDPELAGAAFDLGMVDHVLCIISPTLSPRPGSAPTVGGRGVARMADAWQVEPRTWMRLGDDLVVEGPIVRPDSQTTASA